MARPRRVEPPVPNGFVASAVTLPTVRRNSIGTAQGWMNEAWAFYTTVGELRFVSNWVGNMMSRAILRVFHRDDGEYTLVTEGDAADTLEAYFNGMQGQQQMLQATGLNVTITGEVYHVYRADEDKWLVLASTSVTQNNGVVYVRIDGERIPLSSNDIVIRVWMPHPQEVIQADSPVRSNLTTLSEIKRLNDHITAQLDSRLSGAGILFVPSEIQFAAPPGVDPQANQADAFMQVLGEAMTASIKRTGSAAELVPIVVTAPGDTLDKVQHLTFWTPLDAAAIHMREAAVQRLALGMDIPPEVLLGFEKNTHWSAWMADESSVKSHLEPRLQIVAHAITTAYLQPALTGVVPDPENYVVMADTSQIRIRPNRSNEAIELYDRGELSGDTLRRETGFFVQDKPEREEYALWLLKKVATGSTSPEQSIAALAALGIDLRELINVPLTENKLPPDNVRTDTERGRVRRPDKRVPDERRSITAPGAQKDIAPLLAASEALVMRALERAGNKLADTKYRRDGLGTVTPAERYLFATGNIDHLLEGAWGTANVVLDGVHAEPGQVVTLLDFYVRGLLSTQQRHSRTALEMLLRQMENVLA